MYPSFGLSLLLSIFILKLENSVNLLHCLKKVRVGDLITTRSMGAAGTEDNNLSKSSQLSEDDDDVGVDHEGDSYQEMGSDNNSLMKGKDIEKSDILSYKSPNDGM